MPANSGPADGDDGSVLVDVFWYRRSQAMCSPYNLASALLVEGLVMLWLLVMGVNVQRWKEQASAGGRVGTTGNGLGTLPPTAYRTYADL